MKYILLFIFISFLGCKPSSYKGVFVQESEIQLAPPEVTIDKVFFDTSTIIRVRQIDHGIVVRYTSDGSEPKVTSQRISNVLHVDDNGIFKFRSYRKGMHPSETVTIHAFATRSINWTDMQSTSPNVNYNSGVDVLIDKVKGDYTFKSDDWYGYQESIVEYSISLEDNETVHGVVVSSLVDQKSWIFSPCTMELTYTFADGTQDMEKLKILECNIKSSKHMNYLKIKTPPKSPSRIDIKILMAPIPDWHPGKGHNPWLFVDEILIL